MVRALKHEDEIGYTEGLPGESYSFLMATMSTTLHSTSNMAMRISHQKDGTPAYNLHWCFGIATSHRYTSHIVSTYLKPIVDESPGLTGLTSCKSSVQP